MKANHKRARVVATACGLLTAALGLLVMIGWQRHSIALIQLRPQFAPMQFNTALCFVLLGTGLVCTGWRRRIAQGSAGLVALIAALTAWQYIFAMDFGLDRLFAEPFFAARTLYPGRMSHLTTFSFLLAAGNLLCLNLRFAWPKTGLALGAGVISLGGLSLLGYLLDPQGLHGWASLTLMAVHTASGFIVAGAGLATQALVLYPERSADPQAGNLTMRMGVGYGLALALMLGMALASQYSIEQSLETERLVSRTHRTLAELEGIFSQLKDMQRGARGFVITGDESYLVPYYSGRVAIDKELAALRSPILVDAQKNRLAGIEPLIRTYLELQEESTSVRRNQGFSAAVAVVRAGEGKRTLDEIHRSILEMTAAEVELLRQRSQDSQRTASLTSRINLLGSALALGITVVSFFVVSRGVAAQGREIAERKRAEEKFAALLEAAPDAMVIAGPSGQIFLVNAQTEKLFGYPREELIGQPVEKLLPERLRHSHAGHRTGYFEDPQIRVMGAGLELHGQRKDGSEFPVEISLGPLSTAEGVMVSSAIRDITERKYLEGTLRESEQRLTLASTSAEMGLWDLDLTTGQAWRSLQHDRIFGYDSLLPSWSYQVFTGHVVPEDRAAVQQRFDEASRTGRLEFECRILRADQVVRWISAKGEAISNQQGQPIRMAGVVMDITDRKHSKRLAVEHAVSTVLASTLDVEVARRGILQAICECLEWDLGEIWEVDQQAGVLRCGEILQAAPGDLEESVRGSRQMTFRSGEGLPGRVWASREPIWVADVCEDASFRRQLLMQRAGLRACIAFPICLGDEVLGVIDFFRREVCPPDDLIVDIFRGLGSQIGQFLERARTRRALEESTRELARSNAELEQFAYVASHDLQEPLRSVAGYVQLLARRYHGKLDKDADDFIGFAVEGAQRMQGMIEELLTYSRAGRPDRPLERVETDAVLNHALKNLDAALRESGAMITREGLPVVRADRSQLSQVFQNLIGNALKFRNSTTPRLHVAAARHGQEWVFSVRDNGIGIDPQFIDNLFVIFKRLHTRQEYPGHGMGLAICKKIIQRHGGRIWVESQPGSGATFCFTLPSDTSIAQGVPT